MLSPLDDYPVHQIAEPIRFVGTSDRNFYDRYYFQGHPRAGGLVLTAGLGAYPNRDVCDAFLAVSDGGAQRVVRASRQLGVDRTDTRCGPFRVEVVEPLRRLRVVLEPGPYELACDLTWTGSIPCHWEPDQVIRHGAQLTTATKRFAQTSRLSGTLEVAGERFRVEPSGWWGNRDRSWGVRMGLGEPEAPGARTAQPRLGFFWIYCIAQFEAFSLLALVEEDREGRRRLSHATRVWNDPARPVEDLGHVEHAIELAPGTRCARRGALRFERRGGATTELRFETGPCCFLGLGTGYGVEPEWRHGMWQGAGPVVQERRYDVSRPGELGSRAGLNDNLARFELEGLRGSGLFEFAVLGPYAPYGFASGKDVAR